jgi:hypothetical protein
MGVDEQEFLAALNQQVEQAESRQHALPFVPLETLVS